MSKVNGGAPTTGQDPTREALALIAESTAEHHRAVLALQQLFATRGGELSTHFLSINKPIDEVLQLDDVRSFAVINFSPTVTVQVGFGGRQAQAGSALPVPPVSFLQLPLETNLVEIGATLADLGAVSSAMVAFIRFKHLVNLAAGPLEATAVDITGPVTVDGVVTPPVAAVLAASSPGGHANVGVASGLVLPANPGRKGSSWQNLSQTETIALGLDTPAVIDNGIVLLPGASWDGQLGYCAWIGPVNAIATAADTPLAIVEV